MLFANYTGHLTKRFGVEKTVNMIADAGFPAVDITMLDLPDPPFCDDWRSLALRLRTIAKERGISYVQAHAPVGKWDHYIEIFDTTKVKDVVTDVDNVVSISIKCYDEERDF